MLKHDTNILRKANGIARNYILFMNQSMSAGSEWNIPM